MVDDIKAIPPALLAGAIDTAIDMTPHGISGIKETLADGITALAEGKGLRGALEAGAEGWRRGMERLPGGGALANLSDASVETAMRHGATPGHLIAGALFMGGPKALARKPGYSTYEPLDWAKTPTDKTVQKVLDTLESNKQRIYSTMTPEAEIIGRGWYNMKPVRDSIYDTLPVEQADQVWKLLNAGRGFGSPMSNVSKELERALYWVNAHQAGKAVGSLQPPTQAPWGAIGSLQWFKEAMPGMGRAQRAAGRGEPIVARGGGGLAEDSQELMQLDARSGWSDAGPGQKTKRYALAGMGEQSMGPVDRHILRSAFLGGDLDPRWAKGIPTAAEQKAYDQFLQQVVAPAFGVTPAQAQAWSWVGGAKMTNVTDARGIVPQLNDVMTRLSNAWGKSEVETWDDLLHGKLPTGELRDFALMPDKTHGKKARKLWDRMEFDNVSPEEYIAGRNKMPKRSEMLTKYTVEELREIVAKGGEIIMDKDRKIGQVIKFNDDGYKEAGGLYSLYGGEKGMSGIGLRGLDEAIRRGATHLDAFEVGTKSPLTQKYGGMGFKEDWRFGFDPKELHHSIDPKRFVQQYGTPDIVGMSLPGAQKGGGLAR
jgi:hypothetical protein